MNTFSAHLLSAGGSAAGGRTLMPGAQVTARAKGDDYADLKKWASKTLSALKHQLELVQNPDNSK
jgi:multidrug efflux pump subunit AcrB